MTRLLELAERIEKAEAAEQRALLWEAAIAYRIGGDRFKELLSVEAFLDAAMMLVPEGAKVTTQNFGGPGPMALVDPNERFCGAATLPLALCAAALRARASQ